MSADRFIIAESTPPSPPGGVHTQTPPRPAVPGAPGGIPPAPSPQLPPLPPRPVTPAPAPPVAATPTQATPSKPSNTEFWIIRRDNTQVGIALGLLLVVVVLGWFMRGWVMQMAARSGVDPLRAGGFGNAVWFTFVLAALFLVVGFLYQIFLVTEFLITVVLALVICLFLLWLTSRSLRRRRA